MLVTKTRIPTVVEPPAKELHADNTSKSSDFEDQKANILRKKRIMESKEAGKKRIMESKEAGKTRIMESKEAGKTRIMESKEAGKKRKAADKTHENELEDQSDVGSYPKVTIIGGY